MTNYFLLFTNNKYFLQEFIKLFLKRLREVDSEEKTSTLCQVVYEETLSKHHHWLIRKGAKVGMYTLPKRDELLEKVILSFFYIIYYSLNVGPQLVWKIEKCC